MRHGLRASKPDLEPIKLPKRLRGVEENGVARFGAALVALGVLGGVAPLLGTRRRADPFLGTTAGWPESGDSRVDLAAGDVANPVPTVVGAPARHRGLRWRRCYKTRASAPGCSSGIEGSRRPSSSRQMAIGEFLDHLGLSPSEDARPPPEVRYVPIDDEGRELAVQWIDG